MSFVFFCFSYLFKLHLTGRQSHFILPECHQDTPLQSNALQGQSLMQLSNGWLTEKKYTTSVGFQGTISVCLSVKGLVAFSQSIDKNRGVFFNFYDVLDSKVSIIPAKEIYLLYIDCESNPPPRKKKRIPKTSIPFLESVTPIPTR